MLPRQKKRVVPLKHYSFSIFVQAYGTFRSLNNFKIINKKELFIYSSHLDFLLTLLKSAGLRRITLLLIKKKNQKNKPDPIEHIAVTADWSHHFSIMVCNPNQDKLSSVSFPCIQTPLDGCGGTTGSAGFSAPPASSAFSSVTSTTASTC